MTNQTHWASSSLGWGQAGPPLKPSAGVLKYLVDTIGIDANILVLGVTQEYHRTFNHITAVDCEPTMIERVWLGDTDTKRAILANWLTVDLPLHSFDAVITDGGINMLYNTDEITTLLARVKSWLKPNGQFISRMFTRPDVPYSREYVSNEAYKELSWSAYRRLPSMIWAEENNPFVPHHNTWQTFHELVPDTTVLPYDPSQVARMEHNKDKTSVCWHPTRAEILEVIPSGEFIDILDYDIAHTCPLLIIK